MVAGGTFHQFEARPLLCFEDPFTQLVPVGDLYPTKFKSSPYHPDLGQDCKLQCSWNPPNVSAGAKADAGKMGGRPKDRASGPPPAYHQLTCPRGRGRGRHCRPVSVLPFFQAPHRLLTQKLSPPPRNPLVHGSGRFWRFCTYFWHQKDDFMR